MAYPPPPASGSPELTLDSLIRFIAALSTGSLPTQPQLSTFLTALVDSPLLNHDAPVVAGQAVTSQGGKQVVDRVRGVVHTFKELLDEKNADDRFQRLLAATARAESVVTTQISSTSSLATSSLSPSSDVSQILSSLRTTFVLIVTSSTLRRLVGQSVTLFFELFAEVRDAAQEVLTDVAEADRPGDKAEEVIDRAKDQGPEIAEKQGQKWFDRHFPSQPEDALIERLQELIKEVRSDDRFSVAVNTVLDIAGKYLDTAKKVLDQTETAKDESQDKLDEVVELVKACIGGFVPEETMEKIKKDAETVVQGIKDDDDLRKAMNELSSLVRRLIDDPTYSTSQRFTRRLRSLRSDLSSSTSRQSDSFRSALSSLQTHLSSAYDSITSDPKVSAFVEATERFSETVVGEAQDGQGVREMVRGPMEMGKEWVWENARFWIAKGVEMVRLVALPRFEYVNEEWDVAIDGFTILPPDTGFLPSTVRLTNLSDLHLHALRHSSDPRQPNVSLDPSASSYTRFQLRGVRGYAKDVSTYVKRKTGWVHIEEEGYEDIVLGLGEEEGLNVDLEVGMKKDATRGGRTRWDVRKVQVKLEGFAIYPKSLRHPILTRLALPTIQSLLQRQLEARLETLVRAQLETLEDVLGTVQDGLEEARKQGRNADTWGDWFGLVGEALGQRRDAIERAAVANGDEEAQAKTSTEVNRAGIVRHLPDSSQMAVGFEAQLLPGKATPVSRRKQQLRQEAQQGMREGQQAIETAADGVKQTAERVMGAVGEGREVVREARERADAEGGPVERLRNDRWKSDAFDLRPAE